MIPTNSPLAYLAAFAIAFAVGALSVMGFTKYIEKVREDALRAHQEI
ncbi:MULTISPECIES: hypothetical protein [unclassified Polaromonas]|nr:MULTISPECIES: hypothetical protein [unclassified Polaromonas]MBG6073423.1 hypothetical protein [Polaromonas sp. CG_9.7]MBG6115392.1 hypothetical protein [Polaromonas sp. CG_9.2]